MSASTTMVFPSEARETTAGLQKYGAVLHEDPEIFATVLLVIQCR